MLMGWNIYHLMFRGCRTYPRKRLQKMETRNGGGISSRVTLDLPGVSGYAESLKCPKRFMDQNQIYLTCDRGLLCAYPGISPFKSWLSYQSAEWASQSR